MAETGEVQYLVIGFRPFGRNPCRVTKVSEAWDTVLRHGELAKATVNLDLEEPDGGHHIMETTAVYIGDEPLKEVDEQVETLLSTVAGTIPLDRGLGIDDSFIDKPTEAARSLYVAEVAEKIPRYIPTLSVDSVNFTAAANDGKVTAKVVLTNA